MRMIHTPILEGSHVGQEDSENIVREVPAESLQGLCDNRCRKILSYRLEDQTECHDAHGHEKPMKSTECVDELCER